MKPSSKIKSTTCFVQIFMLSRHFIWMILSPWHFLYLHHEVDFLWFKWNVSTIWIGVFSVDSHFPPSHCNYVDCSLTFHLISICLKLFIHLFICNQISAKPQRNFTSPNIVTGKLILSVFNYTWWDEVCFYFVVH